MDWTSIKAEYVSTDISYRALAKKYGVPFKTLAIRARDGNWVQLREQYKDRTATKMIAKEAQKQIDRYARMLTVTDKLLAKIESAIDKLDDDGVILDKSGTRALAGAIQAIKDCQSLKSDLDIKEQEARIKKLQKEAQQEEQQNDITITIQGGDDAWAK